MKKKFAVKPNQSKKTKKKYPYKIQFTDGRVVPVPSQHDFSSVFIRKHGCSLAGLYMALRFRNKKKSMRECLNYMESHYSRNGRAKYSLRQIAAAIDKISGSGSVVFYKNAPAKKIRKALKRGGMVLFEETNPIHTAVLLNNGKKILRFSDGSYKKVTMKQEAKRRCKDPYYGGCIIIKA